MKILTKKVRDLSLFLFYFFGTREMFQGLDLQEFGASKENEVNGTWPRS